MKKQEVLNTGYKLSSALELITSSGKAERLEKVLEEFGFDTLKLDNLIKFVNSQVTKEEYDSFVEQKAFTKIVEAFQELQEQLDKHIAIANGYAEMGNINLTIAKEDHHLEEEGAKLHEMDSKKAEGNT